jgi:hypothetical protein
MSWKATVSLLQNFGEAGKWTNVLEVLQEHGFKPRRQRPDEAGYGRLSYADCYSSASAILSASSNSATLG